MFVIDNTVIGTMAIICGIGVTFINSFDGEFILEQPTIYRKVLVFIRKFWTSIFIIWGLYIMVT
jgi:hypothetical protein